MRFIHTSDWQIGKTFRLVDDETLAILRAERLDVISRIGRLAQEHGAAAVLVAGDVFDVTGVSLTTLLQPIERMRQFTGVEWHLVPGNHDAHGADGPWERLLRTPLPPNIKLHTRPEPQPISGTSAWVLPAILTQRHSLSDTTLPMDAMSTPEGALRIGLAHGSVRSFGSTDASTKGVESLKQAREHLAARIRIERERERHESDVRSNAPADAASGLAAGPDALRNQIALVRRRSQLELEALGLLAMPTLETAREAARLADLAERDTKEALTVAKAPLPVLQKQAREALVIHSEAAVEVTSAVKQAELLAEELTRETSVDPQDRLAAEQAEALNTLDAQQAKLEAVQSARPVDTVALMDARITRYESKNAEDRDERGRLLSKIAVLQSNVEKNGGLGLDEQLDSASRQAEDFALECDRLEREIKILQLLKRELSDAERAAKERYMAPLVQRITPYLQTLFPGTAIHVDEDFQVTGVIRELQREEFGGLSWGTQEQIAVLTRVAFADMLLDTGKPAMLILDDALVYADLDRLERMFDLLTHASARLQILVLTCRGELFTRLGCHRVELLPQIR